MGNKKEKGKSVDKLNSMKEIVEKSNSISKMVELTNRNSINKFIEATEPLRKLANNLQFKNPLTDFIEQQKKFPNIGWYSNMMKATQSMRDLKEAAKIANPLSEFIESQKHISQTMKLASISENIKTIQPYQSIFAQSKTLDFLNSIQSNPALNAVQTINNQYNSIFSSIKEIAEKSNVFHKIISETNSWRFIIDQISLKAIENEDWEFIQNFQENTEGLYSLSEQVLNGKITQEEFLEKSQEKIESNKTKIWIQEQDWFSFLFGWFFFVFGLYYSYLGTKSILEGQKDIKSEIKELEIENQELKANQESIIDLLNKVSSQHENKSAIIKEKTPIYITLDENSEIIDSIPKDSKVFVSYKENGWCFINFKKSTESLPIAGWIKEDYLRED